MNDSDGQLARGERGYTLVEMLVVMSILGVVMAGLTTIFVSGSRAELDINRRFQAQQEARLALDKIRTDLHCADKAEAQTINTFPGLKISAPNCSGTTISWCVLTSPTMSSRFALYRSTSTTNTCQTADTTMVKIANYLTTSTGVFSTPTVQQDSLEFTLVDFPISANPASTRDVYELKDAIVARNSARCPSATCVVDSTSTLYHVP
jgi:prepilin-type N-terminal cleavage/methylation domain-containing protein